MKYTNLDLLNNVSENHTNINIYMYIIYKHTSKTSGKSYIGFTSKTIQERFLRHIRNSKRDSKNHFHRALKKYGVDDFITELIEETEDKLREVFWIDYYDTFKNGYNMTKGGEGGDTVSKLESFNPGRFPGSKNPKALKINIYNDENKLMFECHGNLGKICSKNNLPFTAVRQSYLNNTTFYPKNCIPKKRLKYRKWYAKCLVDSV